jgi:hypothetical protein
MAPPSRASEPTIATGIGFRTAVVEQAFRYWASKCGAGRAPRRRDLLPDEIPALLPHVFLVDVAIEPLSFRFRLVGTAIGRLACREYTGSSVNEAEFGPNWQAVYDAYTRVVRTGAPDVAQVQAPWPGRQFVCYERLAAPLSSDGSRMDMLFGCLHPVPDPPAR